MRFEFTYPFLAAASVNHAYNQGCSKYGLKKEVREWREGLTWLVRSLVQGQTLTPPLVLKYRLYSPKRTGRIDAGNYAKIIEDSVFDALLLDDNDSVLIRGPYSGSRAKGKKGWFAIILEEAEGCYSEADTAFFARSQREELDRLAEGY